LTSSLDHDIVVLADTQEWWQIQICVNASIIILLASSSSTTESMDNFLNLTLGFGDGIRREIGGLKLFGSMVIKQLIA
jgi:hypothetical protein